MKKECDILICGSGIIGLTIARELVSRGHRDIIIIEKEGEIGMHASGRNSGVLHAGLYYSPDSLKAKSCIRGNRLMKQYCKKMKLPLVESGKVIVARTEDEVSILKLLYTRARANGTKVKLIDKKELAEIEPSAITVKKALYSPETAVINPKEILMSLYNECIKSKKVEIHKNTKFIKTSGSGSIKTNRGIYGFKTFINAGGANSDKIAHAFGLAENFRLIPFKGTYKKLKDDRASLVHGNIYPVPDLKNPFLGVHFTRTISGEVFIGPTAIPAFGRENYRPWKGLGLETLKILYMDFILFIENIPFRTVAISEPKKYLRRNVFNDAKRLVSGLAISDIIPSSKAGIRPQLVDWEKKSLVMDFMVLRDSNSIHILNAISPAFTGSMEFARIIADEYLK